MAASTFRLEVSFGDASFSAEGDSDLVMQAFETFRGDLYAGGRDQALVIQEKRGDRAPKDEDKGAEVGADPHAAFAKGTPLGAFLTEKAPKTNDSAVAVMAVWANANEGTTEFTISVMEDLWRRSPRKKPANLARDMGKAAKRGWLDEAGRAKYALPSYGIDYVRGLPEKKD
jgi:hypothetical protein